LLETLAEYRVAPREIEIELTETGLFQATEISRQNLSACATPV
jgi:EAL domain-containing protein (putative c-di-GMP-specific phosphodiesterase class I)